MLSSTNPINHGAALSKSMWWKFGCRNGYHIVKSNICFMNCLDHSLVIINLPHPSLMSLKEMDFIILSRMGCTILVDNAGQLSLLFPREKPFHLLAWDALRVRSCFVWDLFCCFTLHDLNVIFFQHAILCKPLPHCSIS
jgi:hypothetical protein